MRHGQQHFERNGSRAEQQTTLRRIVSCTDHQQRDPRQSIQLIKGPFAFDTSNGDTSTAITRTVVISSNDIHPLSGALLGRIRLLTNISPRC